MKNPQPVLILLAVVGLLTTSSPATATKPAPYHSFVRPVGEKFVFVMRTDDGNLSHFIEEYAAPQREIHKKYKASGLYRVDDPVNPLWTVDWIDWPENLLVLKDGVHLVWFRSGYLGLVSGSPPHLDRHEWLQARVIEVYANGKSIWSRQVDEVVPYPALLPDGRWYQSISAYTEENTLEIRTRDSFTTVFDYRTGEIRSQTRPIESRLRNDLGLILTVAVSLVVTGLLLRRRVLKRRPTSMLAGTSH
ncbi:hypothetical protein [Limnoglobus roseus]|uniref:Uncharacterized protein n=1 Tax=Limnoglobus roseus TaxID=2598579 RepID=A0A5C1AEF0_9BACT|nr:hypothetical protein [Limnoglobus roseus]QEL16102.1 hypothetical protein PX52LOC_03041 [Limnoglobus roseus]